MSFQTVWHFTDLPEKMIDIIQEDLAKYDSLMGISRTGRADEERTLRAGIRKSKNTWISSNHWISGFLMHYVMKANRENFLYDIDELDGNKMQYTYYESGDYYNWHTDSSTSILFKPSRYNEDANEVNSQQDFLVENTETMRKLSFILQLSDPSTYKGGNIQFLDEADKMYVAPRTRGAMIIFDSRTKHRVTKLKEGNRKSIVGWVNGPRWK